MRDNLITRPNPPPTQPVPTNPKRGKKKREAFALYEASQQPNSVCSSCSVCRSLLPFPALKKLPWAASITWFH